MKKKPLRTYLLIDLYGEHLGIDETYSEDNIGEEEHGNREYEERAWEAERTVESELPIGVLQPDISLEPWSIETSLCRLTCRWKSAAHQHTTNPLISISWSSRV